MKFDKTLTFFELSLLLGYFCVDYFTDYGCYLPSTTLFFWGRFLIIGMIYLRLEALNLKLKKWYLTSAFLALIIVLGNYYVNKREGDNCYEVKQLNLQIKASKHKSSVDMLLGKPYDIRCEQSKCVASYELNNRIIIIHYALPDSLITGQIVMPVKFQY